MNAAFFPAALCIEVPVSDSTRTIRVRAENGPRLAAALVAAGFQAEWLGAGTAYIFQDGGCSDPGCCVQHICRFQPHLWGCVVGRKLIAFGRGLAWSGLWAGVRVFWLRSEEFMNTYTVEEFLDQMMIYTIAVMIGSLIGFLCAVQ